MSHEDRAEKYFEAVEAELNRERAALLGRFGERVELAQRRVDRAVDDLTEFRAARQQLVGAIDDLCLQREMLGLNDHSWVRRIYPLPPAR